MNHLLYKYFQNNEPDRCKISKLEVVIHKKVDLNSKSRKFNIFFNWYGIHFQTIFTDYLQNIL